MRFTVLGRYGRFAPAGGATAGILVESGDTRILLDCGSGVVSRLQEFIEISKLDAVFLSHLHGDHCGDFLTLRYFADWSNAEIKTFLPDEPVAGFNFLKDGEPVILKDGFTVKIKNISVTVFKVFHADILSFGFLLSADGKNLAYTGDTVLCDNFLSLVKNADTVIGDACILERDRTQKCPHLSVLQLAKVCGDKKLYLTHVDSKILDETVAEAKIYAPFAELVLERKTYEV